MLYIERLQLLLNMKGCESPIDTNMEEALQTGLVYPLAQKVK